MQDKLPYTILDVLLHMSEHVDSVKIQVYIHDNQIWQDQSFTMHVHNGRQCCQTRATL